METVRQALGLFLILDLAAGFVLLVIVWLVRKRSATPGPEGERTALLAGFGCLTLCLVLIYVGLSLLSRTGGG